MTLSSSRDCPKCKKPMVCIPEDIFSCQCSQIHLNKKTEEFLKESYYETCLCKSCLENLNKMVQSARERPLPDSEKLVEGIHYTIENSLWVFSEFYHIQKGYCCKNKCKNCPYGFTSLDVQT